MKGKPEANIENLFAQSIKVLGDIQKAVMKVLNTERKDKLSEDDVALLKDLSEKIKAFNIERQTFEFSTDEKIVIVNSVKEVITTLVKTGMVREEE